MICTVANSLWLASCASELVRFRRGLHRVGEEQQEALRRILSENADTEFGQAHGFRSIRTAAEYQQRVPLGDFDRHQPWIDRAVAGASHVLTRDPVRLFEPTSGSSGATKLIPYTASLQREFQRGIRAWVADLFQHSPGLLAGPAYWSVSPVCGAAKKTAGGIPIGFDDDTSYLAGWQRRLVKAVMAVPDRVRLASDLEAFRYATLLFLVRARDLRLISVWNPTFLSLLLDGLPEWGDRLCHDLADPRRGREVSAALRASSRAEMQAQLWPKLGLISCWTDANAAGPAAQLGALFPHCRMQGKGLIATEALVSFPLTNYDGSALAIRSHFLEFLPLDSDRPLLAHQLDRGARYAVVVTTGGGLYRYQLGDQVEVTGRAGDCPLIRFVGRQASVSDWFGEKLNDAHVACVLREVFSEIGIAPSFAMLACDSETPARYVLYVDCDASNDLLDRAAASIENRLRTNFHYDYARRLGQLDSVRALLVRDGADVYLRAAVRNGMKAGDVKVPALSQRGGWSEILVSRTNS